ncbi:uncharacterized protein LOC142541680 [Primulina tabacum]|uniref:uncharacterized protein LOC142541680 n=1 Tax=Primulina tabacum TaxID=48773 RepID=UPI003F593374
MGCGESKHAVATANTTVAKSKSKRSESNSNPPVQNVAANESVNAKENEIPEAIFEKKEGETLEDGKKNTLAKQEDIGNGASGEEGEGNAQTSSDYKTKEDGAKNQELEKGCAKDPENVVAGGDEEEKAMNSCDHSHDPPTKNEEGLQLEYKESTSVGEEENANAADSKTN